MIEVIKNGNLLSKLTAEYFQISVLFFIDMIIFIALTRRSIIFFMEISTWCNCAKYTKFRTLHNPITIIKWKTKIEYFLDL